MRKDRRLFAGIFLLSFSVLIFEITLIRWLSVVVASKFKFFRWRRDFGRDVPIAGNTFYTGKYLFVAAV